jgi:hypothetical protein
MYIPTTLKGEVTELLTNPTNLKSYLELVNGVMTDYAVKQILVDTSVAKDGKLKWYYKAGRDKKIFKMAEEAQINLIFPDRLIEDYDEEILQVATQRYIWLGNMMFEHKITDAEAIQKLFYGTVGPKIYNPETGVPEYLRVKGYYDYEDNRFFESDYYKDYTKRLNEINDYMKMKYTGDSYEWTTENIEKYNLYKGLYEQGKKYSDYQTLYTNEYFDYQNILEQLQF